MSANPGLSHLARARRRATGNRLHTLGVIAAMLGMTALLGHILAGPEGLVWAVVLALATLFVSPRLSPGMVLRFYRARPLGHVAAPRLNALAVELAREAGLRTAPRLYLIDSAVPNAFTVGGPDDAALAMTQGALSGMSFRELRAVMAHEISHIRHNDLGVTALADVFSRVTSLFSALGQILLLVNLPLVLTGRLAVPWSAVLVLLGAPLVSGLLQLALSRRREYDADLGAVELTGDPRGLAMALAKLEARQNTLMRRLLGPGAKTLDAALLRTHPAGRDRIARLLELERDYEVRPSASDAYRDERPTVSRFRRLPRNAG